jgi:hypothetical protein
MARPPDSVGAPVGVITPAKARRYDEDRPNRTLQGRYAPRKTPRATRHVSAKRNRVK